MRKPVKKANRIIKRVWKNRFNGQKLVTIPFDAPIDEGDYVEIIKNEVTRK